MKKIDSKSFLLIAIVVILLLVLPIALYLAQQKQEIRKKAASPTGTASMRFEPLTGTKAVGEILPVNIKFQTFSTPNNLGITEIEAVLTYTFSGTNPFTLAQGNQSADITPGLPTDSWSYLFKKVSTSGNTVTIDIVGDYTPVEVNGYLGAVSQEQTFATINFHAQNNGTINLTFDSSRSVIQSKSGNQDILQIPASQGTYTVGGGSTPTPTPTGGVTGTPTPTLTPTVTPTPTGGITPTPTGAPSISRISNYCGKPLETILTIYGTDFGATQGESKVYFSYKASSVAANSTYKEVDANIISWTNTTVFAKVPEVDFGSNNTVVSKVKLVKQGYTGYPANFPPGEVAFFSISKDATRNIGDLDCNNAVNFADFAILFNNWDK